MWLPGWKVPERLAVFRLKIDKMLDQCLSKLGKKRVQFEFNCGGLAIIYYSIITNQSLTKAELFGNKLIYAALAFSKTLWETNSSESLPETISKKILKAESLK
jgi:hypothetical protein